MRSRVTALVSIIVCAAVQAVPIRVATFNIGAHFTADGYPDYSLGDPSTPDHQNVALVLSRINADVVALQEIASADVAGTPDDLDALAARLGYPYVYSAPVNADAPLAGPIDTSLRVAFLSRYPFLTTQVIRSPQGAKEITRLFPVIKVDVPGTTRDPVLISAHLKSGTTLADRYRRTVEMRRLTGYLVSQGLTVDDNFMMMGDFNLSSSTKTFSTPPADLPVSFVLGSDIALPITYSTNPLSYFSSPKVTRLDPRQLNNSASTFQSGSVIDLFLVSPAIAGRPLGTEIYNSTLDVSNTAGLAKSGSPLPAATSASASDHYAVFADFELDADFPNLDAALSASTILEGSADGTANLTVTLPASRTTALTVNVASDDPATASPVSATITIPAGTKSATVAIRTVRNFSQDLQRSVTLTVSASGYDPDNVVLQVNDADGPYTFLAPGETINETFNGFIGTVDPAPWTTTGGTWQGADTGTSGAAGFHAYGTPTDSSLGFLPGEPTGVATTTLVNQSAKLLTALRISFTAEQWRAALGGTKDTLKTDLVIDGVARPVPELLFEASTSISTGAIANGLSTAKSAMVTGLAIPSDASFGLRFTFTRGSGGGVLPADVFVNEIHYDNASTDTGEFVEVVAGPGFTGNLSNVSLLLYNGSDGKTYGTHLLSTFTAGDVTSAGYRVYSKFIPDIQNGNPDGLAVVVSGAVSQFISYGGSFNATNGSAMGMTSTDIGVKQSGNDPVGQSSLGLMGTGNVPANFTWTKLTGIAHSPGRSNSGQTFTIASLPSQGVAMDNLAVTFLADNDSDGIPDIMDPDDDNDGSLDVDELVFATDPFNAASKFAVDFSRSGASSVMLSFPTVTGRSYKVESSLNLSGWTVLSTYLGNETTRKVTLGINPLEKKRFYRVGVTAP